MKLRIDIPEEEGFVLDFNQNELPGLAVINQNLQDKNLRKVFRWHASVIMHFEDVIMNGMPSERSNQAANLFEDEILSTLNSTDKPIGLWLANITWNKTKEIVFRLYEPEVLNEMLLRKTKSGEQIEFEITDDPQWDKTEWIDKQISLYKGNTSS